MARCDYNGAARLGKYLCRSRINKFARQRLAGWERKWLFYVKSAVDDNTVSMLASRLFKATRSPLLRSFAAPAGAPGAAKKRVVLFPGHGIGPEITESVLKIFDTLKSSRA